MGEIIQQMRDFVDQVYVPDTLAIAGYYKDWFTKGEGVGNFLTYGDFPLTALEIPIALSIPNKLFIPRGVILDRDLSVVYPLDMNDPRTSSGIGKQFLV